MFEAPCPECGAAVELFKDESSRRCPHCGHRFQNPGIDFGCAQWCALAEQCLGFAPQREHVPQGNEGALASHLIQRVGEQCRDEPGRLAHALKAFHYAKELVAQEGGDPRVVIAAALLMRFAPPRGSATHEAGTDDATPVEQILRQVGADEETIRRVCDIVVVGQGREETDSVERRVARDADALAGLLVECSPGDRAKLDETIRAKLTTEAARAKARSWYEAVTEKIKDAGSEQSP